LSGGAARRNREQRGADGQTGREQRPQGTGNDTPCRDPFER
jgi:hypothetical protein